MHIVTEVARMYGLSNAHRGSGGVWGRDRYGWVTFVHVDAEEFRDAGEDDWERVQRKVKARDRRCRYCGTTERLTVHHIVPRPDGTNHPRNLITLCVACHDAVEAPPETNLISTAPDLAPNRTSGGWGGARHGAGRKPRVKVTPEGGQVQPLAAHLELHDWRTCGLACPGGCPPAGAP